MGKKLVFLVPWLILMLFVVGCNPPQVASRTPTPSLEPAPTPTAEAKGTDVPIYTKELTASVAAGSYTCGTIAFQLSTDGTFSTTADIEEVTSRNHHLFDEMKTCELVMIYTGTKFLFTSQGCEVTPMGKIQ